LERLRIENGFEASPPWIEAVFAIEVFPSLASWPKTPRMKLEGGVHVHDEV
jgi:hypothetical protein